MWDSTAHRVWYCRSLWRCSDDGTETRRKSPGRDDALGSCSAGCGTRRTGKRPPGPAAVIVGDNPASHIYVRNKHKACRDAGLASWVHTLSADTSQSQLLELIAKLNTDSAVHGILIQLPLPKQIDEDSVIRAVASSKDVDCFHPENIGLLAAGASALLSLYATRRYPIITTQRICDGGERNRRRRAQQHSR